MPRSVKEKAIVEEKLKPKRARAASLRAKKVTLENLMKGKTTIKKVEPSTSEVSEEKASPKKAGVIKKTKETQKKKAEKSVKSNIKVGSLSDPEVKIPNSPSLRLMEKVELYHLWYNDRLPKYAETIAKQSGYLFLFIGLFFSFASYYATKDLTNTGAVVVCSGGDCYEKDDAVVEPGEPKVTFLNTMPEVLSSDIDFAIRVENSDNYSILLKKHENGVILPLTPHSRISTNEHRYLVPASTLTSGRYTIFAELKNSDSTYKYSGPDFRVEKEEIKTPDPKPLNVETLEEKKTEESGVSTTSEEKIIDSEVASTSPGEQETEEVDEPQEHNTSSPVITSADRLGEGHIELEEANDAIYVKVTTADARPHLVEIMSSAGNDSAPYTLGQAYLFQNEWIFSLTALELPIIQQAIFARYTSDGVVHDTPAVNYFPKLQTESLYVTTIDASIFAEKVKTLLAEKGGGKNDKRLNLLNPINEIEEELSSTSSALEEVAEDEVVEGAEEKLEEEIVSDTNIGNRLLTHYASALQTNNKFTVQLAEARVEEYAKRLALEKSLENPLHLPYYSSHFINLYREKMKEAKVIVENYDHITDGLIARDTDGDGLSDFDEITIYETNLEKSDSDDDGVIDTVEILSGTNPEVAALSQTPSTVNYPIANLENEAVVISAVRRSHNSLPGSANPEVFYIVEGKSIPRSFVNIIDYDRKSLGIIRTGSTGEFSFTLPARKDASGLAISAVLADSFGQIEAGSLYYAGDSNFNARNKSSNYLAEVSGFENFTLLHNLVLALLVVSLGFVLVLLSRSFRSREITTKKTKNA